MQLSKEEFRRLGYVAVDMAADYLAELPARPVFQRMEESERQALMNMPMPADPLSGDEILRLMAGRILPHPMGNGHPRFFGWVNSPPAMMAVITEMLAAAMNPSCAGGDHAAIYLEHCAVRWLMELLGFPMEGSRGLLVSGGSAASLTALTAARHRALGQLGIDVRARGVAGAAVNLRLYASTQVHSSVQKAVELLGLGSECIRWIGVDDEFRMSLDELREAIERDRREGCHPFCLVANAGSVQTGAIDPLNELADVAAEAGLWLHVDGAYGAAGMADPDTRPFFAGIERADSIALDPHKWLSVPVECGCILVRDGALLREAFSLVPPYLRTESGKGIGNLPWFSEYGFQQTRGFRALKLWVTLAHAGTSGLRLQVARQIRLARYLEQKIEGTPGLELRSKGKLSIVCFRYLPRDFAGDEESADALNKSIMERVQADGIAFLTNTTLAGRFVLRACILHYRTTERDIDTMLEAVESAAAGPLVAKR
jgi:glutamate/tyrosine decarboxylase-like PLP-dependent enzyme